MKNSKSSCLSDKFSHIYIEEKAFSYPITEKILSRFVNSEKITIKHYKDVFCRPNQDFQLQKASQKLILAVKENNFLYKGPDLCQSFGHSSFYYTSTVLNCIYNCDYCYLQGMYPSAYITAFVNIDDFFYDVSTRLEKEPMYLTISYDTDLLSLENLMPFTSMWLDYASKNPALTLEVRTKSSNFKSISHIPSTGNVILAWTLSPQCIIDKHEELSPSLDSRLKSILEAIDAGWNVRLCFDPVVMTDNWQKVYEEFILKVFSALPYEKINDVSVGSFRMSCDYLKRIRKQRKDSALVFYPFECKDGIARYPAEIEKSLLENMVSLISNYIDKERIYL